MPKLSKFVDKRTKTFWSSHVEVLWKKDNKAIMIESRRISMVRSLCKPELEERWQ